MRRIFFAVFSLPASYALSLYNFQRLASDIPQSCQNAYKEEIPYCGLKDFTDSCSAHCITGLYSIAGTVSAACEDVITVPNTLLGFVLGGTVVKLLCPSPEFSPMSISSPETIAIPPLESNRATGTRNINKPMPQPTTLSLAVGPPPTLGSQPKSTISASYMSTSPILPTDPYDLSTFTTITNIHPTDTDVPSTMEPHITLSHHLSVAHTTTKSQDLETTPTRSLSSSIQNPRPSPSYSNADGNSEPFTGGSGGGSPFDVQSCASNTGQSSLYAMLIALFWTGVLQR